MVKHVVDIDDLDEKDINNLIKLALDINRHPRKYVEVCRNKILATLFFEPSTRTRLSFEAAMQRLGGSCIGFSDANSSSASKGESLSDTILTVSNYADIIALRHPLEGAAYLAASKAPIPIINAGDGGHSHPTQTLADLLTIFTEKSRFSDLTIGLCGDLKFGRPVHSLVRALVGYPDIRFILISPLELRLPDYVLVDILQRQGVEYLETDKLEDCLGELDILYMTRVQQERFFNEADYIRLKDSFILDEKKLTLAKEDMSIMHPLPRVNEISISVDQDPRACYFKQVKNGMLMRQALIMKLLGLRM